MRYLILILLMTVTSLAQTPRIEPGVSQELAKWRAARYSDVRYKLDLTLEKMSPVMKGTIEVRVYVRPGGAVKEGRGDGAGAIILDWRKIRGHEEKSTISNVSINGTQVQSASPVQSVSLVQSASFSSLPAGEERDKSRTLSESFEESNEHLIFRDGVVMGENVIKLDFTSPILPSGSAITRYIDKEDGSEYIYSLFVPSDASTAFPVFDQPDLKARFELEVKFPNGWTVVGNTGIMGSTKAPCDVNLPCPDSVRLAETKPISTYVFAFAAGPWQQVSAPGAVATQPLSVPSASAGGSGMGTSNPSANADGTDSRRRTEAGSATGGNPSGSEGANPKSKIRNPKSDDTLHTGRVSASSGNSMTSIYVRKSQLAKFQPHAAEVFRLNREAIKYFEDYFDYKFPFPKYDLVLIPEFPFGGMEHAGATFVRESSIIFPQEPTKNDHITRATLIFHEAAHQWFGDTVTMRWFDDLWLKEGFATFTAYKAMEKIMPEMNSWKVFYERIKQGAYQTDSTKGTTAIYQPIANLSAAKSAYGNIVYNKAPAFLRQAEFYLGEDKFRAAVRAFLKKHEFENASWEDLVSELGAASKMDLSDFAKTWVTTPGMPKFFLPSTADYSQSFGVRIFQRPVIAFAGSLKDLPVWKEKTKVFLLSTDGRALFTDITHVSSPTGTSVAPAGEYKFVFPNYQDYGYGIFLLDDKSRDYVVKNVQKETDPFLRSMMWGALWDSVREGELDPKDYVELAIKVLSASPVQSAGFSPLGAGEERDKSRTLNAEDESTTAMILNRVSTAMTYYLSDKPRETIAPRLEALLVEKMRNAPTLGQRITFYRAFLNLASTGSARNVLKGMLTAETPRRGATTGGNPTGRDGVNPKSNIQNPKSESIPLKTKDRFDIVTKLASLGDPDAEKLLTDLERTETSDDAKRYAYAARAAFPTKEAKEKYWNDFINNKQISESWIEAAFGPFNSVRHADLTLPYLERALKELPNHKRNRKIFFVNGWLGAFIGGQRSEEALAIVNKFLADNPNLDRDLRLKILENVDVIERAVKIRSKFGM
ncbi:MAG TPA: M1 family aminopeptidase [Pyrinomonadaceae bacterium]